MTRTTLRPETAARNLTQAFEALSASHDNDAKDAAVAPWPHHGADATTALTTRPSPAPTKPSLKMPMVSPSSVADPPDGYPRRSSNDSCTHQSTNCSSSSSSTSSVSGSPMVPNVNATCSLAGPEATTPQTTPQERGRYELVLHPDLQRDLSHACLQRIAFYSVIHDINKEALAMAGADTVEAEPGHANQAPGDTEEDSSLVAAVLHDQNAAEPRARRSDGACHVAVVDEEEWLLQAMAQREPTEQRACPDTFLKAIGEQEYENPIANLAGSTRTQLWKPSRSWWEAKSGKNPWIEPTAHNKRWRYLWPLIHYHKFLAKCIKKLKRHGIDVKHSISPVAVFLREEVCAVSDHLAALSLFDSDEWMSCLGHFDGWCAPESEDYYRNAVASLKLRPVDEPGDVDSPLLRSQIDEHFLKSMANARAQLRESHPSARAKMKPHNHGQPPMYPRGSSSASNPLHAPTDPRRSRGRGQTNQYYPPPYAPWWVPPLHFEHAHPSMRVGYSAQTMENLHSMQAPVYHTSGNVADYHGYQYPYQPPMSPDAAHPAAAYMYDELHHYDPQLHYNPGPWVDPNILYHYQMQGQYHASHPPQESPTKVAPKSAADLEHSEPPTETPEKEKTDVNSVNTSMSYSPFWSHLDQAAMANLATPVKTPRRPGEEKGDLDSATPGDGSPGYSMNAQPLLLQHYYGNYISYGSVQDGYGPPSPATQFMMSPQNNHPYTFGYNISPVRKKASPKSKKGDEKRFTNEDGPKDGQDGKKAAPNSNRGSPSTVETTSETVSLPGTS